MLEPEVLKNPSELWGKDNTSFVIVRDYLHAIRTDQTNKAALIYSKHLGLTHYFDFVRYELKRNPYFAL